MSEEHDDMGETNKESSLDDTYLALKAVLASADRVQMEFDGKFETERGIYNVSVLYDYFGVYLNEEGYVEVHVKILEVLGLPKKEDEQLIRKLHETILDCIHGGNPKVNPEDVLIVPEFAPGAVQFDDNYVDKVEEELVRLFREKNLSMAESADLLNRMLDRMANIMTTVNDEGAEELDRLLEKRYGRKLTGHGVEDIHYIN